MTHDQWIKLSPEEQRIKIAVLCGAVTQVQAENCLEYLRGGYLPEDWREVLTNWDYPDYLNDLNAMHKVERGKIIGTDVQARYIQHLTTLSWDSNYVRADGWGCFATAAQRAEAFVLTMDEP